jgi:hypothetical protein
MIAIFIFLGGGYAAFFGGVENAPAVLRLEILASS